MTTPKIETYNEGMRRQLSEGQKEGLSLDGREKVYPLTRSKGEKQATGIGKEK